MFAKDAAYSGFDTLVLRRCQIFNNYGKADGAGLVVYYNAKASTWMDGVSICS